MTIRESYYPGNDCILIIHMAMGECSAYSELEGLACSLAYELPATWR